MKHKLIIIILIFLASVMSTYVFLGMNFSHSVILYYFKNKIISFNNDTKLKYPLVNYTGIKWDYAYLYTDNYDFRKVDFFNNKDEIVYSENLSLNYEGEIANFQVLFERQGKDNNIIGFKCSKNSYLYLKNLDISKFIFYFYPINCSYLDFEK